MAEEVMGFLRSTAPQREVEVVIAPGVECQGDERLLRIVLENLLGNAWKFTSKRRHAVVEVGVQLRDRYPVYFVRDNGAGFDLQYAGRLFTAFQRLHSQRDFPGNGVGLATVQRIISRHGGVIWPESAVDRGATFYFSLAPGVPHPSALGQGRTAAS
jgi:light-regulated signal transduction histidine kinase (bacteriophytochrome)